MMDSATGVPAVMPNLIERDYWGLNFSDLGYDFRSTLGVNSKKSLLMTEHACSSRVIWGFLAIDDFSVFPYYSDVRGLASFRQH